MIKRQHTVVDATLGSGGHARAIIEKLDKRGTFIGFDADVEAVRNASVLRDGAQPRIELVHANFRIMQAALTQLGIECIDAALFDLGWRIEQLTGRGFSFEHDEPLLMTFDAHPPKGALTAREIVNEWDENHIADILFGWGGEHFSRRIAHAIVTRRAQQPIERTAELAALIRASVPAWYRTRRVHPATKSFQALRIAVNDEMGALKDGMAAAYTLLRAGGRVVIITFHSVEDRIVKHTFREWEQEGKGSVLTKKPIIASREETQHNPRARSAKLRVFQKM